jgi:hypothetical protein
MIFRVKGIARIGLWVAATLGTATAPLGNAGSAAQAQSVRDHTRPDYAREATVDETQAADLTLTVAPVGKQLLQTWIRTAGALDASRRTLTACVAAPEGGLVRPGQRVRAFPPDSKSSIYQARVKSVAARGDCVAVEAALSGPVYGDAARYVMEIIVDRGQLLAVANAAIIERNGSQIVYLQHHPGMFVPREIRTGLKGETYTEVLDGLEEGDNVVTIGSFFVDADYRLKTTPDAAAGDAHNHH